MEAPGSISEAPRLDLDGFWTGFFEICGQNAKRAKNAQNACQNKTSITNAPRVGGRRCSPPGGFQSAAHRRWCEACRTIIRFVELKALNLSLSMPSLNSPSPNAQHPSLILSPAAQGPPQPRPKKASTVGFGPFLVEFFVIRRPHQK